MKAKTFVAILFTLIFVMCAVDGIADKFDWPQWRGPNGDGISHETDWNSKALAGGPKILWKVDVGFGYSNVAIKDNRLYTMGLGGVYCFDADTGEEIWLHDLDSTDDTLATPTTDGKYVCILEKEGVLSCLKAKNGMLLWEKDLISEYDVETPFYYFAASPVIERDLVILTANTSGLALNKKTGKKVWGSEKPPERTIALLKETAVGGGILKQPELTIRPLFFMSKRENDMRFFPVTKACMLWMLKQEKYSGYMSGIFTVVLVKK